MKFPQHKGSPTLDEMLKRFQADPDNFKPDPASLEKIDEELKASREENEKAMKEYECWKSQRPTEAPQCHLVIDMGPDGMTSTVTPEKIKWNLEKGLTVEQIAVKLKRSVKTIEKTLAKLGQLPELKPIKEVPYGWKLTKDKYRPDEAEQWVVKKIEDDRAAGKKFDDIAKELMKVGIKPRGGGLWFMRRLVRVVQENNQMLKDHRASKLLLFEKGQMSPG